MLRLGQVLVAVATLAVAVVMVVVGRMVLLWVLVWLNRNVPDAIQPDGS